MFVSLSDYDMSIEVIWRHEPENATAYRPARESKGGVRAFGGTFADTYTYKASHSLLQFNTRVKVCVVVFAIRRR